ncbi:MAG: type 1 glutamine amidotransferase, partial [Acidimicrobiales bacterium]|nr:type 1 glutamine amidotransferase [Acidimicrobiales bacterium]
DLAGAEVAFLVANEGAEQVELTEPWQVVEKAGGRPVLVAPQGGDAQAFDHLDKAERFAVDLVVADADVGRFAALVLPGGVANPDLLRTHEPAVRFAGSFFDAGKPVAAICHAAWTLIEAGVVRGRRLTSWPSLQTDLRNAGAEWVDEQVVVDTNGPNTLVTSRKPADLPAFTDALLAQLGT